MLLYRNPPRRFTASTAVTPGSAGCPRGGCWCFPSLCFYINSSISETKQFGGSRAAPSATARAEDSPGASGKPAPGLRTQQSPVSLRARRPLPRLWGSQPPAAGLAVPPGLEPAEGRPWQPCAWQPCSPPGEPPVPWGRGRQGRAGGCAGPPDTQGSAPGLGAGTDLAAGPRAGPVFPSCGWGLCKERNREQTFTTVPFYQQENRNTQPTPTPQEMKIEKQSLQSP